MTDLINHGQFAEDEIESVFKGYEYETTDFSDEFIQEHPEIDPIEIWKRSAMTGMAEEDPNVPTEKKYNFPDLCTGFHRSKTLKRGTKEEI